MSRDRIEDLGRLSVLLDNILDHHLFREERMRPKDFSGWFFEQDEDKKYEILDRFAYGIQAIEEALGHMRQISRGEDILNDRDNL